MPPLVKEPETKTESHSKMEDVDWERNKAANNFETNKWYIIYESYCLNIEFYQYKKNILAELFFAIYMCF
jgi:hypothetical protein